MYQPWSFCSVFLSSLKSAEQQPKGDWHCPGDRDQPAAPGLCRGAFQISHSGNGERHFGRAQGLRVSRTANTSHLQAPGLGTTWAPDEESDPSPSLPFQLSFPTAGTAPAMSQQFLLPGQHRECLPFPSCATGKGCSASRAQPQAVSITPARGSPLPCQHPATAMKDGNKPLTPEPSRNDTWTS